MRRRLSVDSKGLKLRQLMPLLERFPDIEVSNANGYFYLNFEEGPENRNIPEEITEKESKAYNFLRAAEHGYWAPFIADLWPDVIADAAEYERKRDLNRQASIADCEHEQALLKDLLNLIKGTPQAGEPVVLQAECKACGGRLFETDPALSKEHGSTVWSHVEYTGCDDPTPVEDLWLCPGCGEHGNPEETVSEGSGRFFRVCCINAKCEYGDYWSVPFSEEDYDEEGMELDAKNTAAEAEYTKDIREDR